MARLPRIFVPGTPYHVTVRGNDRQRIVRCDGDCLRLIDELRTGSAVCGLSIHAYVIMPNHIHLLATAGRADSLAKTMQHVGRRYVRYFNKRYARTGTLWEGRYKSPLVTTDRYVMNCHRYIELNPVRANLSPTPSEFLWSSNRYYLQGTADSLITPHGLWGELGESDDERRTAYRNLLAEGLSEEDLLAIRSSTISGLPIGDVKTCERLAQDVGHRLTPGERGWKKGRPRRADDNNKLF